MNENKKDIVQITERIDILRKNKDNLDIDKRYTQTTGVAYGFNIAIELISGVITGGAIGYVLDEILGLGRLFLVFMVILGGVAGLVNVVRYLNKTTQENTKE